MRTTHLRRGARLLNARVVLIALWLGLPGFACTISTAPPDPEAEEEAEPENAFRVLFIGNSLTYVNDLPGMVAALADSAELERPLIVGMAAAPDYSLEDHWNDARAHAALEAKAWDVVVLQQGPSSQPQNAAHLLTWSQRWADEIRRSGARPALYMVWPQMARFGDFQATSNSYSDAAREVEGMLMPVAEAWREAFRQDENTALYHPDGLHASPWGTYLAAVVILAVLYDVEEVGLTPSLRTRGGATLHVPPVVAQSLQAAAAHANENFAIR